MGPVDWDLCRPLTYPEQSELLRVGEARGYESEWSLLDGLRRAGFTQATRIQDVSPTESKEAIRWLKGQII